jgi:hypothetical protein
LKYILANLIHELVKHGFIRPAMDIYKILSELTEKDNTEDLEEDEDDGAMNPSSIVNIVGLRGDVKPEQPTGGMTVNPFFMDVGDPF